LAAEHTNIAVNGFGRMQKKSRSSGRGKRCRNFARDMSGFAKPAYNNSASATQYQFDGMRKLTIQAVPQLKNRLRFERKGPLS
jgi:hypothetical protein